MTTKTIDKPRYDRSVPWYWPLAYAMELEETGLDVYAENVRALGEMATVETPPPSNWAAKNCVLPDTDIMVVPDFSRRAHDCALPVLIDPPYAGRHSTIAEYQQGQGRMETLLEAGLTRVLAMGRKPATPEMRDFDIDKYLAKINVLVDDLGRRVKLVGLCQGGWMSATHAACFPGKVASLVLAGSPIDPDAGDGTLKAIAHVTLPGFYEEMVEAGEERVLGQFVSIGWKNIQLGENYLERLINLCARGTDEKYLKRTKRLEGRNKDPFGLPGRYYLQAMDAPFKQNPFNNGVFKGRGLALADVICPVYLLGGAANDIMPSTQVFEAGNKLGKPKDKFVKRTAPSGHIGLFMGSSTLKDVWPEIGAWIVENGR